MGLSVVYGIVEAHGGTIDVHSKAGERTTFRVILPIHHESLQTPAAAPASSSTSAAAPGNEARTPSLAPDPEEKWRREVSTLRIYCLDSISEDMGEALRRFLTFTFGLDTELKRSHPT